MSSGFIFGLFVLRPAGETRLFGDGDPTGAAQFLGAGEAATGAHFSMGQIHGGKDSTGCARVLFMNRRTCLTLLASAPIAALAPLPKILERYAVGDVFSIAGHYAVNPTGPAGGLLLPFVTLPTTHDIVALTTLDDYLCARTDDDRVWVIDQCGDIVTSFIR